MTRMRQRQSGFTLVELMIASAIGLLILAGMSTMFFNNSVAQAEIEKANRQVENGRYAIQVLGDDLRNAAYYGEFDPSVLALPVAMPDPCATTVAALKGALPLYLQGVDNAADGTLGCITDVRGGTDIVVVRHASNCTIDAPNCEVNSDGAPYIQASLCGNTSELGSGDSADFYALDSVTTTLLRHRRDCSTTPGSGTVAALRFLEIHIYFVANNDKAGDGIPTLKRAEIINQGGALSVRTVALVEGIENLQMEYGLDTNNDGSADVYATDPASFGGCLLPGCAVSNWTSVVSAKINLLARNTEITNGYSDTKSYVLGNRADGTPNAVGAAGDHYKRHVFQSAIVLPNPAGRRAP
ncbi:MAG: PilW family protein [Pseudomonadota bacterium]